MTVPKKALRAKIKTCFRHKDEYRKKSLPAAELINEMAGGISIPD